MQFLTKIAITALAGGTAFLLTNATGQPNISQLTMSIFVGGIVLVVQLLIDAAEQSRRTGELVGGMKEAAKVLVTAQTVLGGEQLTRLIEAAGRINRRVELQLQFAERQVGEFTDLFDGLRSGRAEHDGEDPDWLLGLTETASRSIDAISMTSFGKHRSFVDEGEFWSAS